MRDTYGKVIESIKFDYEYLLHVNWANYQFYDKDLYQRIFGFHSNRIAFRSQTDQINIFQLPMTDDRLLSKCV